MPILKCGEVESMSGRVTGNGTDADRPVARTRARILARYLAREAAFDFAAGFDCPEECPNKRIDIELEPAVDTGCAAAVVGGGGPIGVPGSLCTADCSWSVRVRCRKTAAPDQVQVMEDMELACDPDEEAHAGGEARGHWQYPLGGLREMRLI